jgi:two-component system sensor kinase FixL
MSGDLKSNVEVRRVAMLQSLGLVPGQRDESLQVLASLAANLADAPTGLVCLIDSDRIFVVGAAGFDPSLIDRDDSFCSHVLLQPGDALWIADALDDTRFKCSRYVVGPPNARFYAGVPLKVNGEMVGTLCVLGPRPRDRDPALLARLALIGRACEAELAERHRTGAVRHALAASADALVDCDPEGRVTAWSEGAEGLFGFTPEEALGAEITLIIPEAHKDNHRLGMRRWRESGAARLGRRLELPAVRRDGSELDIELWMSVSHNNGLTRVHANIRDISERHAQMREAVRAEARARDLQLQLHQVWRLNSLGEMAASLAHELNQPLTAATVYLHAAKGVLEKAGPIPKAAGLPLDRVKEQLLRAGSIIWRMRELLADDTRSLRTERVGEMLTDLHGLLRLIEGDMGVVIEIRIEDPQDEVQADRVQFQQAIVNLVRNAAEAARDRRDGRVVVIGRARSGTAFELRIEDNGPGLEPEELERVFRPLTTTKTSGMGLGLSVTRTIIERHGGSLFVERSAMGGAAFVFELQRAEL